MHLRKFIQNSILVIHLISGGVISNILAEENVYELSPFEVTGFTIANEAPLVTYASPVSVLNFNPQADVQSRNFSEAQADISIRGGTFEGTGFKVGSLSIFDPQTGHYVSELPIDTRMLSAPEILTGAANSQSGFNSTAGTINYSWKPVVADEGIIDIAYGEYSLNKQGLYLARMFDIDERSVGFDIGLARSESDGVIEFGDHEFSRISGRLEINDERWNWLIFGGYQDKFFGWPNMYTPFGVQETEDIQTLLIITEFSAELDERTTLTLSSYFRENTDDYEFDRDRPGIFNPFQHQTEVAAFHGDINFEISDDLDLSVFGDLFFDSIESSNLTQTFQSRTYYNAGTQASWQKDDWQIIGGLNVYDTNRDAATLNPSLRFARYLNDSREQIYAEYSRASQVVGYTAIGSAPSGLFAGNSNLGLERSHNFEIGYTKSTENFALSAAAFYRIDNDLTDWTFSFASTNARRANPVDLDTYGLELFMRYAYDGGNVAMGYSYLEKEADYRVDDVDASFYALNFPNHRITLALTHNINAKLSVRIDNEYRQQEDSILRNTDHEAFFTYASIVYSPFGDERWEVQASVSNLWDDDFEEIPAVPGTASQWALKSTVRW